MTRTIHFVYTVPRSSHIVRRVIDKCINVSGFLPPLYRTGHNIFIPWRHPIRAPHSISFHLLQEFKKFGKVRYYSVYERRTINLKPNDILIGVPAQDDSELPWKKPDRNSIMVRTLKKYPDHPQTYIIMPYSNDPLFVGWASETIKNYGKNLILLAGKFWFDNWYIHNS